MMKILRIYILYRLYFVIALLAGGVLSHVFGDPILAWILYILSFFSLLLHFLIGPIRLVKDAIEAGNVEEAIRLVNGVRFPNLLLKPIRGAFYTIKSQLDFANNDLGTAEQNIRKSMASQSALTGDMRGSNLVQLGYIQLKQGKTKEGRASLMEALKAGITDKEAMAGVYLQLCTIEIQRQQYKVGKSYFKKAKELKSKNPEIVEQIKILDKTISRLPG